MIFYPLWWLVAKLLGRHSVLRHLIRITRSRPYTDILGADGSEIYMKRWWLFNPYEPETSGDGRWFPISIRLHHIRRADDDRHLHDHPWNARTIILWGWYIETREDGRMRKRQRGDTARLRFGEYHKIETVSLGGVWTLFITGPKRGTWGFEVNGVKVPWREYIK